LDFLFITGDAYVDHPSFAAAIIGRVLEHNGFRVGIVPQPDWRRADDFLVMGRPCLGVLVGAGNLDSMLGKLTSSRKARRTDAYSPNGAVGRRPDRATIVYCQKVREIWGDIPIIIGGVEAGLRRFAHYDYWSDSVRRSILLDSQADLLVYGMGERQITETAILLRNSQPLFGIRGTCVVKKDEDPFSFPSPCIELPAWDRVAHDKGAFAEMFKIIAREQDPIRGRSLVQRYGQWRRTLIQYPPAAPLSEAEMDEVYDLPYARTAHPMYGARNENIPALEEVRWSVVSHRGCFGGCAFCAISEHQGRVVQARSRGSILREVEAMTRTMGFKGYVHDIGGPTANFRHLSCREQLFRGLCPNKNCLFPKPCPSLDASHEDYIALLKAARSIKGVKKVFVRSGIRYDYVLADGERGMEFLRELCQYHVSGQLKVAPEHAAPSVLRLMRKGAIDLYRRFAQLYRETNEALGIKKQYLVPYFMTSHPGCGLNEAVNLAMFAAELSFCPEQAQDFIPTPGSLSTCMYYTGIDPFTGESVYVPRSDAERREQRALLQHRLPRNRKAALTALKKAGLGGSGLARSLANN
jgi:uncharacterized radical SAM protein YgiQ